MDALERVCEYIVRLEYLKGYSSDSGEAFEKPGALIQESGVKLKQQILG